MQNQYIGEKVHRTFIAVEFSEAAQIMCISLPHKRFNFLNIMNGGGKEGRREEGRERERDPLFINYNLKGLTKSIPERKHVGCNPVTKYSLQS